MATGQISKKEKEKTKLVVCADCRHFHRDTTGPSYNAYTHVYFMGTCTLGLTPDTPIKQFADKQRECDKHISL